MAENITTYNHLNGFYRPGLSFPEQLKATTVGRADLLEELTHKLSEEYKAEKKTNFMVMGPAGVGKTHFIRVLGKLVEKSSELNQQYIVIQFPEENHRILTFADLLLGMIEILGHIRNEKSWVNLKADLEEIQEDGDLIETAIPVLEEYCQQNKKNLLIMLENIDVFFRGQLRDSRNVKQFKKFITKSSFATFIGTSQYDLIKPDEIKKPPFNLFDIHILDVLSEEQTQKLIQKNLEWDRQTELLDDFDDLLPRIKALYEMSGGNPRLSLILYELIAKENKWDIKKQIEKLLDQSTPFFRNRMRMLDPQERALLESIALMNLEQKNATSISKSMRQSLQQTSSHLNKLLKAGYLIVTDHPSDKRSKIYRIKEGFFGLWLSIGHSREQNFILPRLVEFLEQWYTEKAGREKKRQQIWNSLQTLDSSINHPAKNNQELLLKYLSDIGTIEEQVESKFELIHYFFATEKPKEAKKLIKEVFKLDFKRPYYLDWMLKQSKKRVLESIEPMILQQIDDIIACWRLKNSNDIEALTKTTLSITNNFFANGYFDLVSSFIRHILRFITDPHCQIRLLERVALSEEKLKQWNQALITWNQVLEVAYKANDKRSQGTIYNNISQIYQDIEEYETALEYLQKSLEVLKDINDYNGQGTTLNNISTIHFQQGYYEKALECLEQALSISQISQNHFIEGITLSNLALIFQARNDYERALDCLNRSLKKMRIIGNRPSECITLNNISQVYLEVGSLEQSKDILNSALTLAYEDNNKIGIGLTLYNRGRVYWKQDRQNEAMQDWLLSYKTAKEEALENILEKLSQLAISMGYDGDSFWKDKMKEMPQ
ncbi:tetratricopeptide repeat protein [bacterium]|nr:tetratricopeptide repeat protein [bacterium]